VRNQRRNEILVGLTVLAGIAILLAGFSYFREWNAERDTYALRMRFPSSGGLAEGDQVSVNGVRAGKVTAVAMDRNAVVVTAAIANGFIISADARPVIQMLELMGGKKIEILQGTDPAPWDAAKEMQGTVDPDIAGALAMVGELKGDIPAMVAKANRLLDNANAVAGDTALVGALKETVLTLQALARDMRRMVAANESDARAIVRTVTALTRRADSLLAVLPPRVERSLDRADRALTGADSLIAETRGLLDELRNGRGLVPRLLSDTTLARSVDRLILKVDTLADVVNGGQLRIKLRL
jgi:phospholipid/cholesterol/gamma-HCH transport system substrate-binding protein